MMNQNLQNILNKLYVIRRMAQQRGDRDISGLAHAAIREIEDLKMEVFDLNTWLANNQGLFNTYGDTDFAAKNKDEDTDDSENTD